MSISVHQVRQSFLDFFKNIDHAIYPSAPMVVKDDPTLMFTNAGMNQFKNYFLEIEPAKHKRIANTQRCLRVSGKHNDLEEVGVDTYHHTMFEMLGNWSFGDYFKKEMIAWAWEYLTKVLNLPEDRLYITVFKGSEEESIPRSIIGYEEWQKHTSKNRILFFGKKDNFWEMGETGPCGPCSEIHIDCRPNKERNKIDARELINFDHPQVIEIWNLVFIQYNRLANGKLEKLPNFHVDTGMGLERLTRIVNQKESNYDTDIFLPLIHELAKLASKEYQADTQAGIAFRVIVDHIRAVAFGICDGEIPSNTKAGYVLRRILRRALRFGYSFLGLEEPFMNRLFLKLVEQYHHVFPEIVSQKDFIQKVIYEEERKFLKTLAKGVDRFNRYVNKYNHISGELAFELYDTYGFPIDLTQLMAKEKSMDIDMQGFQRCIEEQKNRSRKAGKISVGDWQKTSNEQSSQFVGYDSFECDSKLLMKRTVKEKENHFTQIVLGQTPFYAESGGQIGDKGVLTNENGLSYSVINTLKENNQIIHYVREKEVEGNFFKAKIDKNRRIDTQRHHSATHLLHAALKKILGRHVVQKGSYVGNDKLRFDFTHYAKLTPNELEKTEQMVNAKIHEQIALEEKRDVPFQQALDMGATALFGEKYGGLVRIITFDKDYSMELCGGTHVKNTNEILTFKILSESSVAAGIRRIEAVCGRAALSMYKNAYKENEELKQLLKEKQSVKKGVQKIMDENNKLKKRTQQLEHEWVQTQIEKCMNTQEQIKDFHFIYFHHNNLSQALIKTLCTNLRQLCQRTVVMISSEVEGNKVLLAFALTDDLIAEKKWSSTGWIKQWADIINGKGGGQAAFAVAQGTNHLGVKEILKKLKALF